MSNDSTCNTTEGFGGHKENGHIWLIVRVITTVLFIVGMLANSLILVVVKRTPSMHSVTNVFLCNLAVSDLVTLLWPLIKIYALKPHEDISGTFHCKLIPAILRVTFVCSVLTLTLLAMERYQALVNTMDSTFTLTLRKVKYFILGIWALAFLNAVPVVVLFKSSQEACSNGDRPCGTVEGTRKIVKALTITYIVLFIVMPIMLTLYYCFKIVYGVYISKTILGGTSAGNEEIQMKKKLVRTFILATAAFILCYAPVGIRSVILCRETVSGKIIFRKQTIFLLCLPTSLKAIMNPFLYAFQSTNYRKAVKAMFRCCQEEKPSAPIENQMSPQLDYEMN